MKKLLLYVFLLVPFFLKAQTSTYLISGTSLTTCASPSSTGTGTPCGLNYDAGNIKFATNPTISSGSYLSVSVNKCSGTNASGMLYLKMSSSSATNDIVCGTNINQSSANVTLGTSTSSGLLTDLSLLFTSGTRHFTLVFVTGVRSYSKTFSVTATPPSCILTAPSTGSASNITTNSFRANWNTVSGAYSYTVNMAPINDSYPGTQVTTSNTFYNFSGLNSGTQYKYQVRANCSSTLFSTLGFGGTIDTPTTTALTCTTPSELSTSNITETGYTATWAAVSGANTYSLETVLNANNYTGNLVGASSNSYTFSTLASGTYKFQVQTNCSNGISSSMSSSLFNIALLTPLSLPTLTSPSNNQTLLNTATSVTFQWNKNGNPAGTNYQFRLRNVTDNVVLYNYTPEGDVSSKTVTLSPGKEYSWVVRATKLGNVDKESAPSTFTISPKPITLGTIPTPMTWHCDKTFTWSSLAGTGNITIELWNTNVSTFNVIASNILNTGSFTWNVGKENSNATDIVNFDVNNSYYLKVYPHNTTGQGTESGAFPIVIPTISITQPTATSYIKGTNMSIAWGTSTNYCGNVTIEYTNSSNTSLGVVIQDTPNDGSHTWAIPSTLADGQYKIKTYAPVSSGGSPVVQYSAIFNIGTDPNCPNCITGQTEANFVQTGNEGFCAAQYLCSQKIIQSAQTNPTNAILREDVAKITLIALLDNPATTDLYTNPTAISFPADNFPVPYNDLSGSAAICCTSYHRYAKVLSYLDYGDGMPPFVRRASFNPTSTIQRIDLLQVYLEAWNIDESTASSVTLYFNDLAAANLSAQQLLYLKKAVQLGLVVNGTLATPIAFRPTDAATREEAFLILKRLRTSTMVTRPSQAIVTSASSYFTPANLTPQNMSIARGMAQGNFSHYSEDGFGIADIGVSLGFGFNYQSFLTEVPDEWKIVEPMGRGWTHGLNAHIFTTITSNDATAKPLLVVAWGDGTFDTYDNTNIPVGFTSTDLPSHTSKIGIGNYDILSHPTNTTYTIKKKDQSLITFTSQGEAGLYRMSSVVDKNSNTLSVIYKSGTSIPFRVANKVIDYVQAPSGRRATFTYNTDNYITNIAFPGSTSTAPRNLTFTYNGYALKTFKDARGQVINKSTTYNYGTGLEAYLLKEIILPKGNKVVNGYNANRKLENSRLFGSNGAMTGNTSVAHTSIYTTTTRGMDNVFVYNTFDTNGLTKSNINPFANIRIERVYDTNHPTKISSFTSSVGVITTSTYFPNGNIDQINYPASIGGYEKFTFDAYNNPLTHRDAKGIITTMTYPDNKNLGSVTKAVGDGTNITQTFTYWANGLPKTSTNNEGIVTNFAYNIYGNLNSVNIPILSLTMTANYDYASRKTSVTNFKNQTSTFTYDENDNTKTETDAQNHTTAMAYDDNDNPMTITNAKGKVTTLTYDRFDRDSTVTFEGSTQRYFYDDATNRPTEFRKAGYATDNTRKFLYDYYTYTGLLRSNGYIQNIDYDSKNRMSGIRGGNNASHQLDLFTYDDLNRLQGYRDFYGFTVGYGYDLNANVTRIDYPNGNKLYKTYDNLNRLKTLTWNTTLLITYNYVGSRLDNMVYGNSVKTAMGYDNAGRPKSLNVKTNNGTGSTIFSSTYTMDNLGNHLGENEDTHPFPTVPLPPASTTTNTYLANNRLNTVTKVTSTGFPTTTETHTYDGDGNVTNKSLSSNLSHDIDDNLTNYTGYGLTMSAVYDALGNRRSVTRNGTETRYVLDINGLANILAETNASNVVQNYYIHGLGLVARIKADGTIHYYHADFRGSTIAMTNASQAITHKYQYDEFGNQTNIQEADPNPFRYVGAYGIMYETPDLSYMRARYYDPTTGRFNSEDPIWSTNLYPYAGNDPIQKIDPTGKIWGWVVVGAGILIYQLWDAADNIQATITSADIQARARLACDNAYLNGKIDADEAIECYNLFLKSQKKLSKKILKAVSKVPGTTLTGPIGIDDELYKIVNSIIVSEIIDKSLK